MTTANKGLWADVYALIIDRNTDYDNFHQFYMGEQNLPVESSEFVSRFGTFFADFRDNLARPIIESAEGRVRVIEFGDGQGVAADALDLWERSRMKVESRWTHTQAMVKGDSYVIVLPDEDGDSTLWPQITQACALLYSDVDPREKVAGVKWWTTLVEQPNGTDKTFIRLNFYFENTI